LHPSESVINKRLQFTMGTTVLGIFVSSLVVFVLLYLWLFNLARRIRTMCRDEMEKEL